MSNNKGLSMMALSETSLYYTLQQVTGLLVSIQYTVNKKFLAVTGLLPVAQWGDVRGVTHELQDDNFLL